MMFINNVIITLHNTSLHNTAYCVNFASPLATTSSVIVTSHNQCTYVCSHVHIHPNKYPLKVYGKYVCTYVCIRDVQYMIYIVYRDKKTVSWYDIKFSYRDI